ncbi:hypothetical protein [Hymenobacter cellulosilyticus]|uniref:Uncharacterized protein n=1 Tax=Hymenobacter cellulosilyticus TaxID=2932248 RepID=A0A8T9Q348_9BACT|nr:hypothetical protein [Hymenobacter cellulosilyticus]UOQ72156.1 hypothetical protein MUN79_26935 [Hymenobacter cellulosilyticus]
MPAAPTSLPVDLSLTAAIRAHLVLSTRQLARYLGVSTGFVSHVEAGRRGLPPALAPRLLRLSALLPPPLGQGPPALPTPDSFDPQAPLPPPDAQLPTLPVPAPASKQLQRRLHDCRLLLLTHGQELARLQARATLLARRRYGLAQLQTVTAFPEPAEAVHYARWLAELVADLALTEPHPANAAASFHVLAARVAGLRAEVAALAASGAGE